MQRVAPRTVRRRNFSQRRRYEPTPRTYTNWAAGKTVMAEARLARLFWEALDHAAYLLTDARLWLFDLMHGPEPSIPVDEQREGDRRRPEVLPIIDFCAFRASAHERQRTECNRR